LMIVDSVCVFSLFFLFVLFLIPLTFLIPPQPSRMFDASLYFLASPIPPDVFVVVWRRNLKFYIFPLARSRYY
jgi:hypothetical protein